jgi:hypothetical protein
MYEAAASCKDIARAPVTNWEPRNVTLADYYVVRYGMKVQIFCNFTRLRYAVVCSARNSVSYQSLATLRGYVRRLFVQLVPPYRISHLQRYEVTLCGCLFSS